jgi:cytoskeleton protein RodZ
MLKTRSKLTPEAENESDGPSRDLGRQLVQAREARGATLPEVADYLRIKPAYLEALERGDLAAIPGRPYAMGFLRSYAQYLELDSEILLASLKPTIDRVAGKTELHYREPIADSRRGTAVMVAMSLLLAGGVYTGYQLL